MKIRFFLLILSIILVFIAIIPPQFQPHTIYKFQYGWRYPKVKEISTIRITDFGPNVAKSRYGVEFESYKPFKNGIFFYKASLLPETYFKLGIQVRRINKEWDNPIWKEKPLNFELKLTVLNQFQEIVVDEKGSIDEWFWSGYPNKPNESFIFKSGEIEERKVGKTIISEKIGLNADCGWGTEFVPDKESEYLIKLELNYCDNIDPLYSYRLMAIGAGWKGF